MPLSPHDVNLNRNTSMREKLIFIASAEGKTPGNDNYAQIWPRALGNCDIGLRPEISAYINIKYPHSRWKFQDYINAITCQMISRTEAKQKQTLIISKA